MALIDHIAFCDDPEAIRNAKTWSDLFTQHGSDKTFHNYHYVCGKVLAGYRRLLEIGLGTKTLPL
jgi:hypothetical protein